MHCCSSKTVFVMTFRPETKIKLGVKIFQTDGTLEEMKWLLELIFVGGTQTDRQPDNLLLFITVLEWMKAIY